ncbi:MAG TPA: Gldg family protein [Planctomycetota bacterium]|nr:Gldg family protein [Planctomycetota bacterium]
MNKNIVLAVAKRDLRSWFSNPANYVFIMLFVAVSTVALMWSGAFFQNSLANLDTWNDDFPWIAALFVAAATMGMWASERSSGTQELLFTLPGTEFDLQLGKFLAYVTIYTASLAFTFVLPVVLVFLGNPDWGLLFANYVGLWLFGVMLVSVSMIGSQLSQSGTVAFILSIVFCAVVLTLGQVMSWVGFQSWNTNGPRGQFAEFARGMLPVSGFVLFLGLTVAFFYLSLVLLARRRWRQGGEGVHSSIRFASLAVGALALTVIGVQKLPRIDATIEGIHSLGDESRKLLAGLDPNKPVTLTAYVSEDVPEQFVQQRRLLLNLVDQFDSIGGNAIQKRIVIPQPYSPEAREAESNYGIRPQMVATQLAGGGVTETQLFLGFVARCGTDEVVTPFIEPAVPLEYEITRSIRTVASASRKKVGILKTDVEFMGGMDFQTFRQKPRWQISDELQQQYKIENVDAEKEYPAGLDCLVVPQPSSLGQEQMDRLQAWILAGNPTLLLEDPAPLDAWGTAADDQKGGMQARMMGGGGPEKGNFAGLMAALSLQVPIGEVVWDLSKRSFPGGRLYEEFVFVRGDGVSQDSTITKGLQSVLMLMGGHVVPQKKEGFTVSPLLSSARPTQASDSSGMNGVVRKNDLFQMDFFGGGPQINPYRQRVPRNDDLVMAARVTSKVAEGKAKGVNLIYVADLDLIGNQFFMIRRQMADPILRFDNVTFVLNCIDSLAGDESLVELRKRRPILRKLEKVEEAQSQYEMKWTEQKNAAEKAAREALDKAQASLDAAVAKIRDDQTLDEQAKEVKIVQVQQQENRKLELQKAQIDDQKKMKLEEASHDRDAARKGIHDRYRVMTLVLSVLPCLLLGIVTLVRRTSRAAAIVPASRRVSQGSVSQGVGGGK